jgi:hypothetical protein
MMPLTVPQDKWKPNITIRIKDPPPYFTVSMGFFSSYGYFFRHQTHYLCTWPKSFLFMSTNKCKCLEMAKWQRAPDLDPVIRSDHVKIELVGIITFFCIFLYLYCLFHTVFFAHLRQRCLYVWHPFVFLGWAASVLHSKPQLQG